VNLSLDGLRPAAPTLAMSAAEVLRVDIANQLRHTEIAAPAVVLKSQICSYRPSSSKVAALTDERDHLPDGRVIYGLTLTYGVNVPKSGEITPDFQFLSDTLYESEFESQLWMLFDANKQYIATGDAYPSKYSVRVEKGEYTLLLRVRHEKRELLDKLSDLSLQVHFKLASDLKLDTFYRYNDALTGSRRAGPTQLRPGIRQPLYVAPLALSNTRTNKLSLAAGQQLVGHLLLVPTRGGSEKAGQFPFRYFVPDVAKKASSSKVEKEKDKTTKEEEFQSALKDFKIMWIGKLGSGGGDAASSLLEELLGGERLDRILANGAKLQALDPVAEKDAAEVVRRADLVLADVDRTRLLTYYGRKNTASEEASVKADMEKERLALLEALSRKGLALCQCLEKKLPAEILPLATTANVQDLMNSALEFAEPTDPKVLPFSVKHAVVNGRFGLALRYQTRLLESDKSSAEGDKLIAELYERLGWRHMASHQERSRAVRFPADYRPW